MSRPLHRVLLGALVLVSLALPMIALADALVVVHVDSESHAEGEVTLTARAGGQVYRCTTHEGQCSVDHVPGGHYSVVFTPTDGAPTDARTVMIAPAGRVELHVSAH